MGVACGAIRPRSSGGQQVNNCYALSSGGSHCERAGSDASRRACLCWAQATAAAILRFRVGG